SETLADLGERLRIARVAGEEEALPPAGDDPRRPEPQILISQPATRGVVGRRARECQPTKLAALPPVELDYVAESEIAQPRLDAEGHEEAQIGRASCRERVERE